MNVRTRKLLFFLIFLFPALCVAQTARKPKLTVLIVVDQFRYDYLTRFRDEYTGGFEQLLSKGAVFTNAHLDHFPTVTAIGHSVVLTGAPPSVSGIIGNDWYDRREGRQVTSVSDSEVRILGGADGEGASPRRLLVSTVGDEMKFGSEGKSRVIAISHKARAAILPGGHRADAAFWYDGKSGSFVSSTYYFPDLPDWVKKFNGEKRGGRFAGAEWLGHKMPAGANLYGTLLSAPFGDDLLEEFAERAVEAEKLGADEVPDLLSVSFSCFDYAGHAFGPESAEMHDMAVRTDRVLGKFFRFLDARVGLGNVLIVMTADHGVAPMPGAAARMPGGRMPARIVRKTVQSALAARYGDGKWILSPSEHTLYLNRDLAAEKGLDPAEVDQTAAEAAARIPHVLRVYTREQLLNGDGLMDEIGRRLRNGFCASRAADVYLMLEPYWMFGRSGTTHGTAFSYDTHVPIIFMGASIPSGRYNRDVVFNDIAPTLATILDVETPSGSTGHALTEILDASPRAK